MGGGILTMAAAGIVVFTAGLVVVLNFADYLLVSIGFSTLGVTFQPAAGYTINRQQNAVIKEVGGIYYATGYITGNLFAYEFKQELGDVGHPSKIIEAPAEVGDGRDQHKLPVQVPPALLRAKRPEHAGTSWRGRGPTRSTSSPRSCRTHPARTWR